MSVLLEMSMGDMNEERTGIFSIFQKGSKTQDAKFQNEDELEISKRLEKAANPDNSKTKKSLNGTSKRSKAAGLGDSSREDPPTTTSNDHSELLEVDPNNSRRKRQKTDSLHSKGQSTADSGLSNGSQDVAVLSQSKSKQGFPARPNAAHTIIEPPHENSANKNGQTVKAGLKESDHGAKAAEIVDGVKEPLMALKHAPPLNVVTTTNTVDSKPKRILRLNPKTGTIGSPPKKQIPAADSALKKTSSRGKKSKIVTIQYAPGLQGVGAKIDQILRSTKQVTSLPEAPRTPKKAPTLPSKSTHPFFLGKAAPKRSTPPKKSKQNGNIDFKESLSPHRLQYPPLLERLQPNGKSSGPFFTSGFSNAAKAVKIPGAIEPAWPWKGMLHIRGEISDPAFTDPLLINPLNMQITAKKSKFNATQIPDIENIMKIKARDLHISDIVESIQYNNPDEFDPPPISLRPAVKHNESAMKIQRRVLKELHYRNLLSPLQKIDILSEDGISVTKSNQPKIHPSLLNIYTSITTSLSAFDKGQCDVQDWAHKYSPQRAAEVLQDGNEAFILKDWLQALIVNSVEGGAAQALRTRTSSLAKRASKRKRKSIKLDGFIVSSGEEEFDPDEISEADSESSLNNNRRRTKKTFVQSGLSKEAGKLDNAILISGPSGSGKTASVYAAAKELGFEVFEISSNSRRNGKDIMDKVGDMTRNHLVHRSAAPAPAQLFNAEEEKSNDALADDLKSGRQGIVNSFFITKQTPQSTVTAGSKQSPREQKQSLILIEEVDVLYKEDTQFWATITNLIQSSKRPIVMTCNDESVIESMNLALYGILRFTPPPTDLAVDYMICLAACEGHVLERAAVRSLYEIRHQDLRASIMDLNFWCRFGVGSIKGGLDWYLPRAHGGRDFDESGNALRVVSEGTYQPGMGFLNQDFFQSHVDHLEVEEEMLAEIWEGWQLDVSHWQENLNMGAWANKMQQLSTGRQDKCATLGLYEEFVEAMSDADMCSHGALALGDRVPIGTTAPELKQKVLDDYVLPYKVLETSEPFNPHNIAQDLSIWLRSRVRANMQVDQHIRHGFDVPTELDRLTETDIIQLIQRKGTVQDDNLSRKDFDVAFDPISRPEKNYVWTATSNSISTFNGSLAPIVEDTAPYVRSIVAFDARLAQDRARLSNLLSEGGIGGKRMRTTRAAMSALEGSARKTTRKEKYFSAPLNSYLVAGTGMQGWMDAIV